MSHSDKIRREFAKQASAFANPRLTLARRDYLEWMLRHLPLHEHCRVLDVAAGTGHLSRAVASRVHQVVAVDLTTEMLRELANEAAANHVLNLSVVQSLAEHTPFSEEIFDVVVCRFAVHHFERPAIVLHEMTRTCKRGGIVGIIDLVSPDDPTLAKIYNDNERRRDPSHWCALTKADIDILFQDAGLTPCTFDEREIEVSVEAWLELAKTSSFHAEQVRSDLLGELDGGPKTGMRPFRQGQELMFMQRWLVSTARKAA